MSKIKNEFPAKSRECMIYRSALIAGGKKNGANAMEFEKRNIPYEEVYAATSEALARETARSFKAGMSNPEDLSQWCEQMTKPLGVEAFGMEVLENTKDCFAMDMHFCPHLKGWQELGLSDEMCAKLCDLAMKGDYAMADEMGYTLENPTRLANGDNACRVIYRRK